MPAPVTAALIAAGGQLAGTGASALATGIQNRKSREFSEMMYNRTRADNLEFWRMQNEYNSPERQMQRFKDAGLNPMLAYGGGNAGQAGDIPTPDVQGAQFRVPEFQGIGAAGSELAKYFDYEIKQAQYSNLLAQNTKLLEEALLVGTQRTNIEQGTERSKFDLELDRETRNITVEQRQENLRQIQLQNKFNLDENERRRISTAQNVAESVQRVLNLRSQREVSQAEKKRINATIENLKKDTTLKQLDIELKQIGINENSPIYAKIIARIVNEYTGGKKPTSMLKAATDQIWNYLFKND